MWAHCPGDGRTCIPTGVQQLLAVPGPGLLGGPHVWMPEARPPSLEPTTHHQPAGGRTGQGRSTVPHTRAVTLSSRWAPRPRSLRALSLRAHLDGRLCTKTRGLGQSSV